jgi:hypothetical protein
MRTHALDYGRPENPSRPYPARRCALMLACLLLVSSSLYGFYRWRYYRWSRHVHAGLATVPNVAYAVYGHDDDEDFEYCVDAVVIDVGGDPAKRIVLHDVRQDSFTGTNGLSVARFGQLEFEWGSYEHVGKDGFLADADGYCIRGGSTGLDIASGGRFAAILPLPRPVRTVRDLTDNYDELLAAMERWPRAGAIQLNPSTQLRYTIRVGAP